MQDARWIAADETQPGYADVLAEMNDWVREDLLDEMEPQQVADIAGQLETDDAVALIEDLDRDEQQAVLPADGAGRPRRGRRSAELSAGIRRPTDAARADAPCPSIGASARSSIICARPTICRPISGKCSWSAPTTIRSARASCRRSCARRAHAGREIMAREQTLIPVDMDQEDVALRFQKYALVSAAVVDDAGRLVGMITVDDVVHIIQEEAGEDVLLLVRRGRGRHRRAGPADRSPPPVLAGHQPWHRGHRGQRGQPVPGRDRQLCGARRADADRRRHGR